MLHIKIILSFNTASGKYYCNQYATVYQASYIYRFNTASGKYYCNLTIGKSLSQASTRLFQYRKR